MYDFDLMRNFHSSWGENKEHEVEPTWNFVVNVTQQTSQLQMEIFKKALNLFFFSAEPFPQRT